MAARHVQLTRWQLGDRDSSFKAVTEASKV